MPPDELIKGVQIGVSLLSVALNVYLFMASRANKELRALRKALGLVRADFENRVRDITHPLRGRIETLDKGFSEIDKRVSVQEARVEALPTHDDLKDIRMSLTHMSNDLAANSERTESTYEAVTRIQNYLMGTKQ